YERRDDPVSGRSIVVPGTFANVPSAPVGPFAAVVAIPKGLTEAASVVFLVFLVGGAFAVVEQTGALQRLVSRLARMLADRESIAIPVCCITFALGGIVENMQEEIIPFIPVLLLLSRRLGFDALTAVAMSLGAAVVGSAFSPVNPFQVGIAQKLAGLPAHSGFGFRTALLVPALAIWIIGTMRHARRIRGPVEATPGLAIDDAPADRSHLFVIVLVAATFIMVVVGILVLGWDFDQLSAMFLVMGVAAGLAAGLGLEGTALAFVEGFRSMAGAAMLIGFARAISVVLDEGRVLDTIVHGLFTPIAGLPVGLSAVAMTAVQTAIHFPVPSVSGQAALTMPILIPLADLLGLSRQLAVLAYQLGAGLCELVTPTNGALMAILAAAGVPFGRWIAFVSRWYAALLALGVAGLLGGIALGV
ncbi:MAG: YfcC family protein, partial [Gemmatimonadales bacterium]|nr:YfcC family protein [Gemmatimonadales bacterium]